MIITRARGENWTCDDARAEEGDRFSVNGILQIMLHKSWWKKVWKITSATLHAYYNFMVMFSFFRDDSFNWFECSSDDLRSIVSFRVYSRVHIILVEKVVWFGLYEVYWAFKHRKVGLTHILFHFSMYF